jgi:amidohydrolase
VAAQIINGLQTIVSRQVELTENIAVISIGAIKGGIRSNIIPEDLEMIGTIRTLDEKTRKLVHERIRRIAVSIGESAGAKVEVKIPLTTEYPVTYNDPDLVDQMLPTLIATAGKENVILAKPVTGAEDFSFFARQVPGFFFFLGGRPKGVKIEDAAPHHTPDFYVDESSLILGVRALSNLALDFLNEGR